MIAKHIDKYDISLILADNNDQLNIRNYDGKRGSKET
jgi:hypothetical protein